MAERDAELLVADEEQRRLALSPQEQVAEIADYNEGRGVSPPTARRVAEDLHAADSLGTQLYIDGFAERTTLGEAVATTAWAGLRFCWERPCRS